MLDDIGKAPLCACGCGKPVGWSKDRRRWNKRIQNHQKGKLKYERRITNTDIETYVFADMDLERVVNSLDKKDRKIMILMLMGLTGSQTGKLVALTRSAVCKRLTQIKRLCRFWLTTE